MVTLSLVLPSPLVPSAPATNGNGVEVDASAAARKAKYEIPADLSIPKFMRRS